MSSYIRKRALKLDYKDLFILSKTRVQTKIQKKGLQLQHVKNELRKLNRNSVNTKLQKQQSRKTVKETTQKPIQDVCSHQFRPRYSSMVSAENNTSGPFSIVLHQMTSIHNRSELRIQDNSNESSSSKLVHKMFINSISDRSLNIAKKVLLDVSLGIDNIYVPRKC
ncbi:hypothetical protein Tco_1061858 [Tanacetum coccineum]